MAFLLHFIITFLSICNVRGYMIFILMTNDESEICVYNWNNVVILQSKKYCKTPMTQ